MSKEANSEDPYQTAPTGAVWSGSSLFDKEALRYFNSRQNHTIFGDMPFKCK